MKVLDFHCHVYPDKIAEKAACATGTFYGVGLPRSTGTVAELRRMEDAAGISMQLIHSVATKPAQVPAINKFIAACQAEDPARLIGFGALHPDSENMEADVQQILDLGLHGVKLHPDIQCFALNEPRNMRMFEVLAGRLPVLLHTGDARYQYSNPDQLIPVLEAFPETVFVGAHMCGYTIWDEAERALYGKYENLWADCSSTLYAMPPERAVALLRHFGTGRIMFGTDFPLWDPKTELARFLALPLTGAEQRAILFENAARFLQLPVRTEAGRPA